MTIPQTARNSRIVDLCRDHPDWSARLVAMVAGCTRNAVIGVLHRAHVTLLPKHRGFETRRFAAQLAKARAALDGCRYPHGDPRAADFRYCRAKPQPGSSYCPEHHARCYRKVDHG